MHQIKTCNILFICHGNICRSPMAEFVMKDLVRQKGLQNRYHIASAATSTEELGNPVHPGTRKKLAEFGIKCGGKTARQLVRSDYDTYDYLIAMDENNLCNIRRIIPSDPEGKIQKLLSCCGEAGDIADPWYTGDFDQTYQDVLRGCAALLQEVQEQSRNSL